MRAAPVGTGSRRSRSTNQVIHVGPEPALPDDLQRQRSDLGRRRSGTGWADPRLQAYGRALSAPC